MHPVEAYLEKRTDTSRKKSCLLWADCSPQIHAPAHCAIILPAVNKSTRLTIFEACKRGDIEQVKQLLTSEHVDPSKKDEDGATSLMFAAMRGHQVWTLFLLLLLSLSSNRENMLGGSSHALNLSSAKAIAEMLVDAGAEIDAQDDISGWTALMQATYYGAEPRCHTRTLCRVSQATRRFFSFAIFYPAGHNAIARLLIDHGANVSVQAKNGCTAFDIASIIGDTEVVRLLAAVSMRTPVAKFRVIGTPGCGGG